MKVKFSRMERVAGFFVLSVICAAVFFGVGLIIEKGWFESRVSFRTELPSVEGVHTGTEVLISGLRVGSVEGFTFESARKVIVHFSVAERYRAQIREDSRVLMIRPFVIGEKVLEVSVGESGEALKEGTMIPSLPAYDIMDLLSGKKLGPILGALQGLSHNLKILAEAFSKTERTENLVRTIDEIYPLVKNMNVMANEATKALKPLNNDKNMQILISNIVPMTQEIGKVMPELSRQGPQMIQSLSNLTLALEKFVPAINAVAPELPAASRRALQVLDETVITLKAMQKSFLLRGNVREVKEQEAKERVPAADQ